MDTAMKAAETGHLVISALHTPDAQSTVARIIGLFSPEEQGVARLRLAESLHGVVSQRLLPRADGSGRVAAAEVMIVTPHIRDLMLDESRSGEIRDAIARGNEQYGMQTFDQHLIELVAARTVSYEVAHAAASRPAEFAQHARALGLVARVPTPAGGGYAGGPPRSGGPLGAVVPER